MRKKCYLKCVNQLKISEVAEMQAKEVSKDEYIRNVICMYIYGNRIKSKSHDNL